MRHFLKAVELDPGLAFDVKTLVIAVDHHLRKEEAIASFQKCVDKADRSDLYSRWGEVLVSVGHNDQAVAQFMKGLRKDPEAVLDIESVSAALEGSATTDQLVDAFQELVDRLQNAVSWNQWGKVLLKLERRQAAIEHFQKAISARDQWTEPYLGWGKALFEQGEFQAAVEQLEKGLKIKALHHPETYHILGQALNALEKFEQASDVFHHAVDQAPSGLYILRWQESITRLAEPGPAIAQYVEALTRLFVEHAEEIDYKGCGDFLLALGRPLESFIQYYRAISLTIDEARQEAAITALRYLLSLAAKDEIVAIVEQRAADIAGPEPFIFLAKIFARADCADSAVSYLAKALHLLSGEEQWTEDACVDIAAVISALPTPRHRESALALIEKSLDTLNAPGPYLAWGESLVYPLELHRPALSAVRKALFLDPDHFEREHLIYDCLTELPEAEQQAAIRQIQQQVDGRRKAELYHVWGKILEELRDEGAGDQFRTALRLRRDYADAHHALGRYLSRRARYGEACGQFQEAVEKGGKEASTLYEWGSALLRMGRQGEGVQKFLEALALDPPYLLDQLVLVQDALKWDDPLIDIFDREICNLGTAESRLSWGKHLATLGRYQQAIQQYRKVVEQDPDLMDCYIDWRNAIAEAGLGADSIREYGELLAKYQDNSAWFVDWGRFLFRLYKVEEAYEEARRALEKDPKNSDAHVFCMSCLYTFNDLGRVREEVRALHSYDPDNVWGYYYLALAAYVDGQYTDCIRYIETASRDMFNWDLMKLWAWALHQNGQSEEGTRKLREALRQDDRAEAYYDFGNLLLEQKRYDEAAEQFQRAIDKKDGFAYAYHNLASIPYSLGQYEDGWARFSTALEVYQRELSPKYWAIYRNKYVESDFFFNHANVLQAIMQKSAEAEAILLEGLRLDPSNVRIMTALVALCWEKKEECSAWGLDDAREKSACYWQAMEYFRNAERLLRQRLDLYSNPDVLRDLGILYLTVEDYEKATAVFEQLRRKDDKSPLPYAKLGVIELRQKRYDKAIALLRQALGRNPDDLDLRSSLAEATLRAERFDEAEETYRQVLAITPNHVQSLIGLGEICTARGEKKDTDRFLEAIACYGKALEVAEREELRSKYLTKVEKAAIHYSVGYARVQLYESSGIHRNIQTLSQALKDFRKCRELNVAHQKAKRAIETIEDRLRTFSPHRLAETVGPMTIFTMSLTVFLAIQVTFFLPVFRRWYLLLTDKLPAEEMLKAVPHLDLGYYSAASFGALLFMVVGLYLPQVLKLKVAGIELEKSNVDQAQTSGTLGITKG